MRIVISKIVVSLMLGAGAAVFGALVTAVGLGVAAASGRALDADLSAGLLVAFVAYVLLNIMTGVALGALVHNSAAAIVASFVLPIGFALLGHASQLVANWARLLDRLQLAAQRPMVRPHGPDPRCHGPVGGGTSGRRPRPHRASRDQLTHELQPQDARSRRVTTIPRLRASTACKARN